MTEPGRVTLYWCETCGRGPVLVPADLAHSFGNHKINVPPLLKAVTYSRIRRARNRNADDLPSVDELTGDGPLSYEMPRSEARRLSVMEPDKLMQHHYELEAELAQLRKVVREDCADAEEILASCLDGTPSSAQIDAARDWAACIVRRTTPLASTRQPEGE